MLISAYSRIVSKSIFVFLPKFEDDLPFLQDNFWAVFFAGISVMGLDNYYLMSHSNEAVRKERALLNSMREVDKR